MTIDASVVMRRLEEARKAVEERILTGAFTEMAEYRELVGQRKALTSAQAVVSDEMKRYRRAEAEEDL